MLLCLNYTEEINKRKLSTVSYITAEKTHSATLWLVVFLHSVTNKMQKCRHQRWCRDHA